MSQWWQDQQFWRDIQPFLFNAQVMRAADEDVDEILEELELEPGSRILDVGCGAGRLLIPLAHRGFRVMGIDHCGHYRREARTRAQREGIELDIRAHDIVAADLVDVEPFDAVLDVFAVLGYPEEPAMDVVVAKRLLAVLAPGGQLLIQTRRPVNTSGSFKHPGAGGLCVERRQFDRHSKTMTTMWTVVRSGRQRAYRSSERVYDKSDITSLLEYCGYTDVRGYESASDERIIVVGERPAG